MTADEPCPDEAWSDDHEIDIGGPAGRLPITADSLLERLNREDQGDLRGITVKRATVTGPVNWRRRKFPRPLRFVDCGFEDVLMLDQADVRSLTLVDCDVRDLSAWHLTCDGDLTFRACDVEQRVLLELATIGGRLKMDDVSISMRVERSGGDVERGLNAEGMRVAGAMTLHRLKVTGRIQMHWVTVGGDVEVQACKITSPDRTALQMGGSHIHGSLVIGPGTKIEGGVGARGADIDGGVVVEGAELRGHERGMEWRRAALDLRGSKVRGSVHLRPIAAAAPGTACRESPQEPFSLKGPLRVENARIGSALVIEGGAISGWPVDGYAVAADQAHVEGSMRIGPDVFAAGLVSLRGAVVDGDIDVRQARLSAADTALPAAVRQDDERANRAFQASAARVGGAVWFHDAKVRGRLRLISMEVARGLYLGAGEMSNPQGVAVETSGSTFGGDVTIEDGLTVRGMLRFYNVTVGGNFSLQNVALMSSGAPFAFDGEQLHVKQTFTWRDTKVAHTGAGDDDQKAPGPPQGLVSWRNMSVGGLDDREAAWPTSKSFVLEGFTFARLSQEAPHTRAARLRFVRLQKDYSSRPYSALASYFAQSGRPNDARAVLIAQEADLLENAKRLARTRREAGVARNANGDDGLPIPTRVWRSFLGATVGFGYAPNRILRFLVPLAVTTIILVSFGAYSGTWPWFAEQGDAFIPVRDLGNAATHDAWECGATYPCLNPFALGIEVVTPLVNLRQAEYWQPDRSTTLGAFLYVFLPVATALGWFCATLLVAGLTGLVKSKLDR